MIIIATLLPDLEVSHCTDPPQAPIIAFNWYFSRCSRNAREARLRFAFLFHMAGHEVKARLPCLIPHHTDQPLCFNPNGKVATTLPRCDASPDHAGKSEGQERAELPAGARSLPKFPCLGGEVGIWLQQTIACRFGGVCSLRCVIITQVSTPHYVSFLKLLWKQMFDSKPEFLRFRKRRAI